MVSIDKCITVTVTEQIGNPIVFTANSKDLINENE